MAFIWWFHEALGPPFPVYEKGAPWIRCFDLGNSVVDQDGYPLRQGLL